MPGGPRKCIIVYEASFERSNREQNDEIAWVEFPWRLGI